MCVDCQVYLVLCMYVLYMQEIKLSECVIAFILFELLRRDIIFFCGGLYFVPNSQVRQLITCTYM